LHRPGSSAETYWQDKDKATAFMRQYASHVFGELQLESRAWITMRGNYKAIINKVQSKSV
jgi:hypothetical protein